jgi:hypothetical protein
MFLTRMMLTICIAGCCLLTTIATWTVPTAARSAGRPAGGPFAFDALPSSATCVAGGVGAFPNEQPFVLPAGYSQRVVAREGDGGSTDNWDMNTINETGPHAGRFLFRSHETLERGQVSVTDLLTVDPAASRCSRLATRRSGEDVTLQH